MGELFFIPLFFVWIGASFDFNALNDIGFFVIFFISMALLAKAIGCSLGAKISGVNIRDSLTIGTGMMPRMEVALVVVSTEIAREIFKEPLAHQVMAGTILLVIVSSVITPLFLKRLYKPQENKTQSANDALAL
jgi:Kef-type K+ transport system membrane component KefB